jgi:non-specific protein-tyrosine kinase
MDLKDLLFPLRRWWLLIAVVTILAALSSAAATLMQQPVYQAKTTLMVGESIQDPNPDSVSVYLTQQLAQSYAEIARRKPVSEATMAALEMSWLPAYEVTVVPNTQLLEITVVDTVPERAQAVANTLAAEMIRQGPAGNQEEAQERQAFVTRQLDSLEAHIGETEEAIRQLQEESASMIGARQIAETQAEIAALQAALTTLQGNYATLLATTAEGAVNTLRVIEPAGRPVEPIGPNRAAAILLGAAIGFTIGAGATYLLEYMDDTMKTPEQVCQVTGLPILAYIGMTSRREEEGPILTRQLRSPIAEAFRSLRTNLDFAAVDRPLRTILITGPGANCGKTTVAIDLAIIMAQSGRKTLLLDADLRRPTLHRFLGLANRAGLSDIFLEQASLEKAAQPSGEVEKLTVLTSGPLPANPAELLSSRRMDEILAEARDEADVVVIDSPPLLVVDGVILSAKVDAVLLVVRAGQTATGAARAAVEQLQRANARIVGIVFNGVPKKDTGYYGGYHYYSYARNVADESGSLPVAEETADGRRLRRSLVGRGGSGPGRQAGR